MPVKKRLCGCGNIFADDAIFCRKCGAKRPEEDLIADVESRPATAAEAMAKLPSCELQLAHAFGVYPQAIRDAAIALGDDAVAFAVGRQVAVWDHAKKHLSFLPRKQENCVITAMAKSANGRFLALAERQGSANDPHEVGNVQISIMGLPAGYAPPPTPGEDGPRPEVKEGLLKVLLPTNKRSKIVDLAFSSDARHLVSISEMPDSTVTYWRWEGERLMSSVDVQMPITRMHVNPKHGHQISISGPGYMRIWDYNPNDHNLYENASVFRLTDEKVMEFVDHCWVREEAFLCIATKDGHVHLFEEGERKHDIDVNAIIAKDESNGPKAVEREAAMMMAKMMGSAGPTATAEPPAVRLFSVATWGGGFVAGGDQGYLGIFKVDAKCQVESFGTFRMPGEDSFLWCMSAGSEDTHLNILSYTEKDAEGDPAKTGGVPKAMRSTSSQSLNMSRGKSAPSVNLEVEEEKERSWSVCTFPVSQADLASTGQLDVFTPLVPLGNHNGPVKGMATCPARRVFATCGNDMLLKIWNYPSEDGWRNYEERSPAIRSDLPSAFTSDISVKVSVYEKPNSIAMHPLGFQVAVVLEDMLRIYHVTTQHVTRTLFDLPLKNPGDVTYSNAGNLLAVTTSNDVILIDPWKGVLVRMFSGSGGHLSRVNQVIFSEDDKLLLSCSAAPSGAIYGWDLESEAKDRAFEHVAKGTDYMCLVHDFRRQMCCAIARPEGRPDGSLRMLSHLSTTLVDLPADGPGAGYTALALAAPLGLLFAGMQNGSVRLFSWPIIPGGVQLNTFIQVELHAHSITSLNLSSSSDFLFSSCSGGAVMATTVRVTGDGMTVPLSAPLLDERFTRYRHREDGEKKRKSNRDDERRARELQKKLTEARGSMASSIASLDDLIMIPRSYFHELLAEIRQLEERMASLKHENEYALEQKDADISEKLETIHHERRVERQGNDEKYDSLFGQHKKALSRHEDEMRRANTDFEKRSRRAEDEFDEKLSKEYDKQSRLLAELQSLKDKHDQKVQAIEEKHGKQVEDLRTASENSIRDWRNEYEKVCSFLKSDGLKFEEALRQQEGEYEQQISGILEVKRAVLQVESEKATTLFTDAVSMKQTISMLQGNIVEFKTKFEQSEKRCEDLVKQLQASKRMFENLQEQLQEEKRALKVKNENLAKIREQMKHLESFRFVLFHKVKQMEEERDPLAEQVSSLKSNVRDMYSEFVREFRSKQKVDQQLNDKTALTNSLQQENQQLSRQLIQLKKDGRRMLNDVEQILHADSAAEFERMPKRLMTVLEKYQKLSQWKPPSDEEAIQIGPEDPTKDQMMMNEMVMQRDLLFRKNMIEAAASTQIKREGSAVLRRLGGENAALIAEMNQLRNENRSLLRSSREQAAAIIAMRAKDKAKSRLASEASEAGGGVARAESAPDLDTNSSPGGASGSGTASARRGATGGGMLRGGHSAGTVGGAVASETPYLRRKVVDQQEAQRRQRQRSFNQLPPVVQQAAHTDYGGMRSAAGRAHPPSHQEKRFAQTLDAANAGKRHMERQGFDVGRLSDAAAADGGGGGGGGA